MDVVYYHGGPGLNSRADETYIRRLFEGVASKVHFWDEPSLQRGDSRVQDAADAFEEYQSIALEYFREVTDGHAPTLLVAHSFGANAAIRVAQAFPARIAGVVLLAPGLDFRVCLRNIGACALEDFKTLGKQVDADELSRNLERFASEWPSVAGRVCEHVLSDEQLLGHYWFDASVAPEYLARFEGTHAIDAASFVGVSPCWKPVSLTKVNVSALVLDGDADKIVSPAAEASTLRSVFPKLERAVLPECGHFVHVERTELVRERILAFLSGLEGRRA
ncbi:MAG: alpha/beta fold hydrolase [Polyangiaceae bacterium]